ncbi:hypothetical protein [Dissulfurispira sp.]|uniref:hypothetical protein n=1 Tax=Dissulfurispira sp. TaxID=2817609 RepID=UPI002FDB1EB9
MVEKFGGTAGNIAYSLSLLGENPVIIATIGKDYDRYADNQITGFNPGAMKYKSEYDFKNPEPKDSAVIIGPGNLQDMKEYAKKAKSKGIKCICDPGQSLTQWDGNSLREWVDGSYMLITNGKKRYFH